MPHIISIYGVAQFATAKLPSIGKVPFFKSISVESFKLLLELWGWVGLIQSIVPSQDFNISLEVCCTCHIINTWLAFCLCISFTLCGPRLVPVELQKAFQGGRFWPFSAIEIKDQPSKAKQLLPFMNGTGAIRKIFMLIFSQNSQIKEFLRSLSVRPINKQQFDIYALLNRKVDKLNWRTGCWKQKRPGWLHKKKLLHVHLFSCYFLTTFKFLKTSAPREDETMLSEIVPHIGLFIGSGRRSSMNHNQQISLIIYMDQYMILDFMSSMTHGLESRKKHPRISISQLTNIPIRSFSPHRTQICVNYQWTTKKDSHGKIEGCQGTSIQVLHETVGIKLDFDIPLSEIPEEFPAIPEAFPAMPEAFSAMACDFKVN
ncbi:hypothetical protein VP01_2679g1 [Puccinia sorghi]|uniref:Uncharacterized protein n=1 Tax=Puccinia sorghi TaxID=27349 RepID=A0A0L6V3U7_9BASI|nr:hypothetical protein VP01_2679g1 [Puccinia sorghi]